MNKTQKLILAISIPIIVFFIVLPIANELGVSKPTGGIRVYRGGYPHNPFDWGKTWYVWLIYSISICIFEYKLFADKKGQPGGKNEGE